MVLNGSRWTNTVILIIARPLNIYITVQTFDYLYYSLDLMKIKFEGTLYQLSFI